LCLCTLYSIKLVKQTPMSTYSVVTHTGSHQTPVIVSLHQDTIILSGSHSAVTYSITELCWSPLILLHMETKLSLSHSWLDIIIGCYQLRWGWPQSGAPSWDTVKLNPGYNIQLTLVKSWRWWKADAGEGLWSLERLTTLVDSNSW